MTDSTAAHTVFLDLIVAFLAPMFLAVTGGDINLARAAAIATVSAYRAETHADILTVAQIIAFGIAALGSLSLAMADDLSIALILRLRGNAVSASRAGEQCRRALANSPAHTKTDAANDSYPDEAAITAQLAQLREQAATRAQAPSPPTPPPAKPQSNEQLHRDAWANAMIDVAAEMAADMAHLPPAGRRTASLQAAALSSVASELFAGHTSPLPALPSLTQSAKPA
jgi:hypothetical protein